MKLQQKLAGSHKESYEKDKFSFISDRETEKISHGASQVYRKPGSVNGAEQPAKSAIISKKPVTNPNTNTNTNTNAPKTVNIDVWSNNFTNTKPVPSSSTAPKTNNFDAFNDLFSGYATNKPVQPIAANKNNTNFH